MDLCSGPQSSGHGLVGGILYEPVLTLALVATNKTLYWFYSGCSHT